MKRKYYITIVDLKSGTVQNFNRDESNLQEVIDRHIGGTTQLMATTSNHHIDNINFQQCGTSRDKTKMFSILCCADRSDEDNVIKHRIFITVAEFLNNGGVLEEGRNIFNQIGNKHTVIGQFKENKDGLNFYETSVATYQLNEVITYVAVEINPIYK